MSAKSMPDLSPNASELAIASLAWADQFWQPAVNMLVLEPLDAESLKPNVRNSAWYALGLLLRNADGDRERAMRTVSAVLDTQFDEPGTPYHGTFPRWVGEPHPTANAIEWRDYDPNWRQFIGTTWALILDAYGDRLPADLTGRLDDSIQLAVIGEPPERCPPAYTNIALMKAGLLTWAGDRYGRDDWTEYGETFGQAVYDLFLKHGAFYEYNSPTYYGTDFYALAFWKNHAWSSLLSGLGREMEAALWRDVAQYYHAGLQNICGPYSRSYGMNLVDYGAILGLAIWLGVGQENAPFPDEPGLFDHSHDYCFGPPLAFVDVEIPDDVLPNLTTFGGERLVHRQISTLPYREATAWLAEHVMIGAESVLLDEESRQGYRLLGDQYHPVTMHWRMPDGQIGWMRLRHEGPVDARVEPARLTINGYVDSFFAERGTPAHYDYSFELHLPGGVFDDIIDPVHWRLPGFSVDVQTDLAVLEVVSATDRVVVTFRAEVSMEIAGFTLEF